MTTRAAHLLQRNLIDRAQPRVKVRRRIDVRAPLAHVRELLHQEAVFLDV